MPLSPWADEFDQALFASRKSIAWIRAARHPLEHPLLYKYIRLRRKANEWLSRYVPGKYRGYEKVYVLYSQELAKAAGRIRGDLYIGHNLGALPAVVRAARKWNAKVAFDAEDYHRGESAPGSIHSIMAEAIEAKYIPELDYFSVASPLIARAYETHFPDKRTVVLNNVFSKDFLQSPANSSAGVVGLFWFSQTVGTNRGLETVIAALNKLSHYNWSLTILGQCSAEFKDHLLASSTMPERISFTKPVALYDIFKIASGFDIGLATEVPYCINRQICLTNKLFTYLLAANCIIASDTDAQKLFLQQYPGVGSIYKHDDAVDLATQLETLMKDRTTLMSYRKQAAALAARELNWETESLKLIETVRTLFI